MDGDQLIRDIFARTRTIAVVGLSARTDRPSYGVAAFLQSRGYRILPVNPTAAGKTVLGEVIYPDFASLPDPGAVQMIDIFRRSEDIPPVVEDALRDLPNLETVWMQLGISNAAAAEQARARGIDVIEDRCPRIEFPRLGL